MDGVMGDAPRFDKVFAADLDLDASQDRAVFSKPPLELALNTPLGALRLIGAHVKSKAPHGARTKTEATRISIDNRRKQLAQAVWLRNLADHHLRMAQPVIVLGDLNDGPGLDDYEKLFGQSSVEIIMGLNGPPARRLYDPHAYMALGRNAYPPNTARFYIPSQNRHLSALLDYIMVSPALRPLARQWRIWHPFENRAIARDPALRAALLVASDHFPVTLDLTR
jgi:hypothetical protein